MFAEPMGFDRDELARTLRAAWGIEVAELRYEPVGFGTHHYRVRAGDGTDWFVNVDGLAAKTWLGASDSQVKCALEKALGTAAALREAGLEFVHAPRRRAQGGYVAEMAGGDVGEMTGGYAISLFSFIEGTSHPYGEFPTDAERRLVLAALGRMHAATGTVPPALPARDSLEVPNRRELFEEPHDTRTVGAAGPYAEPARQLIRLRTDMICDLFARYDALVPVVASTSDGWVVTRGEPHAGNVMRANDDGIRLIDWDTTALGPRERDLWMIEPRTEEDWTAYNCATSVDPAAMELYRLWWALSEICGYAATFRAAHVDDENTRIAWRELRGYLTTSSSIQPGTGSAGPCD